MISVAVQSVHGEPLRLEVADDETVDAFRKRLKQHWHLDMAAHLKIVAGTTTLHGSQHVLDAGKEFTAVRLTECPSCGSRLDFSLCWPSTASEEEEQQFRSVSLSLKWAHLPGLEPKDACWLWEGRATSANDSSVDDRGSNYERDLSGSANNGGEGASENSSSASFDAQMPARKKAQEEQADRSYLCDSTGMRRSRRCAACLAETTSLALLKIPCTESCFHKIGTAFPKLQRLLIHDGTRHWAGPPGYSYMPYLPPIVELSNLRMLDLWLGCVDPAGIQLLGSLTRLMCLCILGLRPICVDDMVGLLEPLVLLEVLQVESEDVIDPDEDGLHLDLSLHASLQKLCLEGGIWTYPDNRIRCPKLRLPTQLTDAAIPNSLRKQIEELQPRNGGSYFTKEVKAAVGRNPASYMIVPAPEKAKLVEMLEIHEGLQDYYRKKGLEIGDGKQMWAQKKSFAAFQLHIER